MARLVLQSMLAGMGTAGACSLYGYRCVDTFAAAMDGRVKRIDHDLCHALSIRPSWAAKHDVVAMETPQESPKVTWGLDDSVSIRVGLMEDRHERCDNRQCVSMSDLLMDKVAKVRTLLLLDMMRWHHRPFG